MSRRAVYGAAGVAVAVAAVAIVAAADPFGAAPSRAAGIDNGAATSVARVERRDLSSQTQVSATLGYAGSSVVSLPAGTSPGALEQAAQAVAQAHATLQAAQAGLAADRVELAHSNATLAADRAKLSVDCAGANAAAAAPAGASGGGGGGAPCAAGAQAVSTDRQGADVAAAKVQADLRSAAAAGAALSQATQAQTEAAVTAVTYAQSAVYTALPAPGDIVSRGARLFAIGGQPVLLLYGSVPAWRSLAAGMTPGADVAELNANLRALGFQAPTGNAFTAATAAAVASFQAARGLAASGRLLLGSVVFEPGSVRVTSVTPSRGAAVQPGPVLSVTSTRRVVTVALDAGQQTSVKVGDPVTITLPDSSTTAGHVSFVGSVATAPAGDQGNGSTPTIEVDVTPDRPGATGRLDQAPVDVAIVTASVHNVLVVPVNALLALAGGGYAVEEIGAGGAHRLVAAQVGLFDDALGLVQVSGSGITAGKRVVVPAS